jgi:hypothetical protein
MADELTCFNSLTGCSVKFKTLFTRLVRHQGFQTKLSLNKTFHIMQQQIQEQPIEQATSANGIANPPFTADCRLMENYLLESPVSIAGNIITVRDTNNELNAFTIGNTGKVFHICPDPSSNTGWRQIDLGVFAKRIAAGITTNGLLILYGYSEDNGGSLFYIQQISQFTWGTIQGISGNYPNAVIAVRNFTDGLYFAYAYAGGAGVMVSYNNGNAALNLTFNLPAQPPVSDPVCITWSLVNNAACLVIASNSMLYSWSANGTNAAAPVLPETGAPAGLPLSTFPTVPNQQVMSLIAIEDTKGNAYLFAVLKNGGLYYLIIGQNYWQFYTPAIQGLSITSFTVSLNINSNLEVLALDKAGNLYHSTQNTLGQTPQWSLPWQIKANVSKVASPINTIGSSQAFIISSDSTTLSYISQDAADTDWKEEYIEIETASSATKIASYTMEITLLDSNARPYPFCPFSIIADNDCLLTINGMAVNLNETIPYQGQANGMGKLFLCLQTGSLSAPQFQINTSWMNSGTYLPVQPNIQVQNKLKSLTPTDLLNAPNLLTGQYQTEAVAESLVNGIQQSLNLAQANNTALFYSDAYPAWQYKPVYNSYYKSSRIQPAEGNNVHWQMDFSSGVPQYKLLSEAAASEIIEMKKSSLPAYPPNLIGVKQVSWGDFWQSIKEGIASIIDVLVSAGTAIVTVVVNGLQYFFESVVGLIQQVFDLIEMFFDKVLVTFQKLYDFLKFILNWDDITHSQQVIAHSILQLFDVATAVLTYAQTKSNDYFDTLIANCAASFTMLEQRPIGNSSFLSTANTATPPDGYYTGANNNILLNAYTSHASGAVIITPIMMEQLKDVQLTASDILNTLQNYATQFSKDPHYQNAVNYFTQLANQLSTNIEAAFQALLNGLLEMLSALVQLALSLVKQIISTIISGIISLVNGIKTLIKSTIDIPVVKQVYAAVSGQEFTMLNLTSLIIAIPTTIVYKIRTGNAPFANQAAVDQLKGILTAANILNASGIQPSTGSGVLVLNDFQNFMTQKKVFFSLGNMFCYWGLGLTKVMTDVVTPNPGNQVYVFGWSITSVIFSGLAMISSCPWFYSDVPPGFANSDQANNASWLFLLVPLAEDIVCVLVPSQKRRIALVDIWGPVASTVTGAGLIALFAVVARMQANENKYSHTLTGANMLSTIPSVFSWLRMLPDVPYGKFTKIALGVIDGGCYLSAGILYFVSTNVSLAPTEDKRLLELQ